MERRQPLRPSADKSDFSSDPLKIGFDDPYVSPHDDMVARGRNDHSLPYLPQSHYSAAPAGAIGSSSKHSLDHSIELTDHSEVPPSMSEATSLHSRAHLNRAPDSSDFINTHRVKIESPVYTKSDGHRITLSEKVSRAMCDTPPASSTTPTYLTHGLGSAPPYHHTNTSASMVFAEGDGFLPQTKTSRACMAVFGSNIFVRWFIFITPIMILLWIPGVIGITAAPHAAVWSVSLVWWSSWLSVWWGSWWIGLAFSRLAPPFLHNTLGAMFLGLNKWFGYLSGMKKSVTVFSWAFLSWLMFNIFILGHQPPDHDKTVGDSFVLHQIYRFLFGVFLASVIYLLEKLFIQVIASSFHRKSYADRIVQQKTAIRDLVILYVNSHDIGRSDTLDRGTNAKPIKDPAHMLRSALKGVRNVAQAGTTVFGTVASEIAGERILQPNAPESMVTSALSSANKTRHLARRLYYSFVPRGRKELLVTDIARFFPNMEAAQTAFKVLDKDENGDVSLEEMEMSCLDLHRDRAALASSMRDLDSAVGRLDGILMFLFWIVTVLIIVALMDVSFQTMLASAGTLILGLSWLIGATAQEVLASILFLFVKHPYDVADRVDIDSQCYVVKEMSLLYTVFVQVDGKITQLPHSLLNTKSIINIRRSGPISEPFEFNVDFATTFDQIEALRSRMLEFLEAEKRDFIPSINISIKDFTDQGKMTLTCFIKYKNNWQNAVLMAQRRNKWLCGLKLALAELEIYGPAGAGNPAPPPAPTLIQFTDPVLPASLLTTSPTALGSPPGGQAGQAGQDGGVKHEPASATTSFPNDAKLVDRLSFSSRDGALFDKTLFNDESTGSSSRDEKPSGITHRPRHHFHRRVDTSDSEILREEKI